MNTVRAALIALTGSLATMAGMVHAEIVSNGSFANSFQAWNAPGAPGVQYAIVTSSRDGTNAARIALRDQPDRAPTQDVLGAVRSGGSGTTYVVRFWIESDREASVRCLLSWQDDVGAHSEIIAEQVLRSAGVWEPVEGSKQITWQGTLTNAKLEFTLETIGEGVYPDFTLDDVSIETDSDGDLLTAAEELALGTNASDSDSDDDGLPDGYETSNGLVVDTPDAIADPDGDGASNSQEYWGATDPQDPNAYPGRPSDPAHLKAAARNILKYLALLPSHSTRLALVGQHVTYPAPSPTFDTNWDGYRRMIDRLVSATGHHPALLSMQYDDNANPLQVAAVNPYAIDQWNNGGLVLIKWNPRNPWTGGTYSTPFEPTFLGFQDVLTPGTTANTNYMTWLSEVADGLSELRDAGVVVLWRPCSEMNGNWFWWGRRDRQGYIDFWRHMHDYLTGQRGLDNLIWVYESAGTNAHIAYASDYYYPGDDVVDVMTHNFYDNAWSLPWDAEAVYRRYGKVYGVPQAGPGTTRDGSFENSVYLEGDPAGSGGLANRFRRMSFIAVWESFTNNVGYQNVAIVDNQQALGLMTDPRIVNRENLRPTVDFTASATHGAGTLLVDFVGSSDNAPIAWHWDFGDGGTADTQNASHHYSAPGTYTVTFSATTAFTGTTTKAGFITVDAAASTTGSGANSGGGGGAIDGLWLALLGIGWRRIRSA